MMAFNAAEVVVKALRVDIVGYESGLGLGRN